MRSFFILLCLSFSQIVYSDVIYEKLNKYDKFGREFVTVTIKGGIEAEDYLELKRVLNDINHNNYRLKEDSIFLDSVGGLIYEAKQMGNLIRKHHHATKVAEDAYCESACIFLLVSGSCRMALGGVGIHRAHSETNFKDISEMRWYLDADKYDGEYLEKMGTSRALFDHIRTIPSWDMRYLSDETKHKSGLFSTPRDEANYWREIVSRKIAAPKSFLLEALTDKRVELANSLSWYQRKILKKESYYLHPTCTEQMHLDQLEKYPVGTDKWDEQFELYDAFSGYNRKDKNGQFQTYYNKQVPLANDVGHFWTIEFFKKGAKEITYREETILSKPTEWDNGDEAVTIDMSGKRASRTVTVPNTGTIMNGWVLDPEKDPTGPMTVKVFVDDKLVKIFDYEIIRPKSKK